MKATAAANANIALVKYWGKRDEKLVLPQNASVSVTLDGLETQTTVEFLQKLTKDEVVLDGKKAEGIELERVEKFLDLIREKAGIGENAKVVSKNNFPAAAGLASSASGFAALALAATKAAGLRLDKRELSVLARIGSGSACRSIFGGFVEWLKGSVADGSDSFAEQLVPGSYWPEFRMIVNVLSDEKKKVKSREGMKQSVESSPYYGAWLESLEEDLEEMKEGIMQKDIEKVGEIAEHNCLKMHSLMFTTKPAIVYWNDLTVKMMKAVWEMREKGLKAYFTIDAGPHVKVMCLEKDVKKVLGEIKRVKGVKKSIVCRPGFDARLLPKNLF